jgi:endonuclease IV
MWQPESRMDKIKHLQDLQQGKISIEEYKKLATSKRVVLRTFLDHIRFNFCKDENGNDVDRSAQIREGLIEVELPDTPFNRFLRKSKDESKG